MSRRTIRFFVPGKPATAGSKRPIPFRRGNGKLGVRVVDDCKTKDQWMAAVRLFGSQAYDGEPTREACHLRIVFNMQRPKHHYRTNGELKESAPTRHKQKPDTLKMARAVEDALKFYLEDEQDDD